MLLIKKNKLLPKDISRLIHKYFKLELIYEKAQKNKKILSNDLKHLKRYNNYNKYIKEFKIRINGENFYTEYEIPINHWLINYEKSLSNNKIEIHFDECAKQMMHCCKCGEYRAVSTIDEMHFLSDKIFCNCNPYKTRFIDSKYFVPEIWFPRDYIRFQELYN